MHGGSLSLRGPHILTDNTLLHEPMLSLFAEIFAGHYRFQLPEIVGPA
jgi:hypothetical protein